MIQETFGKSPRQNAHQERYRQDYDIAIHSVIPLLEEVLFELKRDGSQLPTKGKIRIAVDTVLTKLHLQPNSRSEVIDLVLEVSKLDNPGFDYHKVLSSLEEQLTWFKRLVKQLKPLI